MRNSRALILQCVLAAATATLCIQTASAQIAPIPGHLEYVSISSGPHANPTPVEGVVWSAFVTMPVGTPWLRLHYSNIRLEKGSYLRIASVLDGDFMTMHAQHLPQWNYSSCYFNGNSVLVELIAGPNTNNNFVDITQVTAGDINPVQAPPETICGSTDDRVPSSDARTGRIDPIGCTGWIIDQPGTGNNKLHLSAGHCVATGQVLEFAVPASAANCALAHPPAAKQFAIDTTTDVSVNGGIGNDYWVFRCFPNPTTGRTTFEEQGAAWSLSPSIPATNTTLRNYGYGLDGTDTTGAPTAGSCSCNPANGTGTRQQVQQTHTGPLTGAPGTALDYQFDTCGGNSGSPVQNNGNGLAIGIHTHGGCSNPTGTTANHGTQITHPGLQAAILTVGGGGAQANDECTGAITVADGTNGPFNNLNATLSLVAFPCGFNVGNDVWFEYTALCSGNHTFNTCTPTRNFDTVLEVFSGSCASLTSLLCNDDSCGLGSSVTVALTGGTTYTIRCGGYNRQSGNFDLVVDAPTDVIYDAGPLVTHPTGGSGGAPLSMMQTGLGILGFGAQQTGTANNSLADNFATNGAWTVNCIELFAYQTGATAPTITGVFLEIYNGDPSTTGVPIVGSPGFANNLVTTPGYAVTNTLTGIFRATAATPLDTTRRIQSVLVSLPTPLVIDSSTIAGGQYWLRCKFSGSLASGPFVPPISVLGSLDTGNSLQSIGATWGAVLDGTHPQGIPFRLRGSSGSAPGSFTNLGGGCSPATLELRGAPHVGGVVHAELVGSSPTAIPLILLGFTDPSVSFAPFCGCVQHATTDIIHVGTTYNWQVPMIPSGVGLQFYMQGDQVFGPALACNIGIGFRFELTDGWRVRLY